MCNEQNEGKFALDRLFLMVFQVSDLKPIRKALLEKDVLAVTSTAEMAQAYCDAVNRKHFCHNKRVFRPNSWVSRIFDRIGENFKSSAKTLIKPI